MNLQGNPARLFAVNRALGFFWTPFSSTSRLVQRMLSVCSISPVFGMYNSIQLREIFRNELDVSIVVKAASEEIAREIDLQQEVSFRC